MTEREKLQSWRIFLGVCEQEFALALRDLSRPPPHQRVHAEATIRQLTSSLRIVRDGLSPDEALPALLRERVHRHAGPIPTLEDLGVEPRIERGGLRATEARLTELETALA